MSNKMICPVCGAGEVLSFPDGTFACDSEYCKSYEETDTTAYNLLIQAKRDLDVARKALNLAKWWLGSGCIATAEKTIDKALEQIEHKGK